MMYSVMKRLLYFIPSIFICFILVLVLFLVGGPSGHFDDCLVGTYILSIFFLSDFLLSMQRWFGCIPGTLLGAYILYYGAQYHGQIFDEMPIGVIICVYYSVLGLIISKARNGNGK